MTQTLLAAWGAPHGAVAASALALMIDADVLHVGDAEAALRYAADMPHRTVVLYSSSHRTGEGRKLADLIRRAIAAEETVAQRAGHRDAPRIARAIGLADLPLYSSSLCVFDRAGIEETVRTLCEIPADTPWGSLEVLTYCLAMNSLPDRLLETLT